MKGTYRRLARHRVPAGKPALTIQTGGIAVTFNRGAYEALHRPHLIRVSFDQETRIMKITSARMEDEYTIPVRTEGKGSTHVFAGRRVIQEMGLDTSTARQYEATVEAGKLFVDLTQESKLVGKRKKVSRVVDIPAVALPEEQPPEPEHLVEASESNASTSEPPTPFLPAVPKLEGLVEALLPVVEW